MLLWLGGSSLIYAPPFYAMTDELKALVAAAAPYGGGYISHVLPQAPALRDAVNTPMLPVNV